LRQSNRSSKRVDLVEADTRRRKCCSHLEIGCSAGGTRDIWPQKKVGEGGCSAKKETDVRRNLATSERLTDSGKNEDQAKNGKALSRKVWK